MIPKPFRGAGGLFGGGSKQADDTLFSNDSVEVILGISEGPIKGLKDGGKSFYLGETPLLNSQSENNFEDFDLDVYKGNNEVIKPKLGGQSTSTSVSVSLATDTPVVRQGTQTEIDYLDVRLVVQQLVKSDDDGTHKHIGKVKVEYKALSDSEWQEISAGATGTVDDDGIESSKGRTRQNSTSGIPNDRVAYSDDSEPSGASEGDLWFDENDSDTPYVYVDGDWEEPDDLESATVGGYLVYTWTIDGDAYKAFTNGATAFPPNGVAGDYWVRQGFFSTKVLINNGTAWVKAGESLNNLLSGGNGGGWGSDDDDESVGGVSIVDGAVVFNGKVTSSYVQELRIPVESVDEAYELRVTKLTEPNTEELFFDVSWESFQEVTAGNLQFPDLAVTQLFGKASNQFSSIPEFWGVYQGRVVQVPSNYNATTRVYTGVWDGTWILAYTNNPAYIVHDLVMNDRYGLNAYYPCTLNKWDVYDAGVWCDTKVGPSLLPRFTFNHLIQDPRSGKEMINFICGTFGGRFVDDGNGTARILIDKDEQAVALFTPENVVDGIFTYSYSDIAARHNDVIVSFINPALNWNEDRRRVYSQAHIDRYGRIPHNFVAVGCTNAEEAIRRATVHMLTATTETGIVSFKTNRLGLFLFPYQVILIADEDMATGISGRVKAVTGAKVFSLRDAVYLEPGVTYKVKFQTEDGVLERTIDNAVSSGSVSSVTTISNLPDLPEYCVFSIESEETVGVPKAYRVLDISEGNDPDHVEITAIEVNRLKWDEADDAEEGEDPLTHEDVGTARVNSPAKIYVNTKTKVVAGKTVQVLTISWDRSTTRLIQGYRLYHTIDSGIQARLTEGNLTSFEVVDPQPGNHVFMVTTIGLGGRESHPPTAILHKLQGEARTIFPVENLRLVNEPDVDVFESNNPKFQWDQSTDPFFLFYQVEVYDPEEPEDPVRTELVTTNEFIYDYNKVLSDFEGTPSRDLTISVTVMDTFGHVSPPVSLSVNNPAPPAPDSVILEPVPGGLLVGLEQPVLTDIRDAAGMVVYASKNIGFTPDTSNRRYIGPDFLANLSLEFGTWYLRVGYYDNYSTEGVILSEEQITFVAQGQQTRFDNLDADVRDAIEYSFELAALAEAHLILTTRVEDSNEEFTALVEETIAAQALENEAFALAITNLQVTFDDVESDLSGLATIVDSHTVDIEAIDTDLDGLEDTVSAHATSITSLTTQVGENEATISTIQESVDGVSVRFGVVGSINGVTGGFILEGIIKNDGTVSYSVEIAGAQIQDGAISANKIAANAVTAAKVNAGAITADKIGAGAVTADKIGATAVTAGKIAANAVTAGTIAADAITAVKIQASAVTTDKLILGGVTTTKIADAAVTAANSALTAGAITVDNNDVVQTVVITRTTGTRADIDLAFEIDTFEESDNELVIWEVEVEIRRGSTTLQTYNIMPTVINYVEDGGIISYGGQVSLPWVDTASVSGSQSYTVRLSVFRNNSQADYTDPFNPFNTLSVEAVVRNRFLGVTEYKK